MIECRSYGLILGLVILVGLASPVAAFGAGNIASTSKVEGQNWRHGDIEDVLLTLAMARAMKHKKFNKIMVSRVYFGNWLRDYSQAIDVGTVKSVSAEAIRLLLCVLGFLTFGYGSGEFEVTADRLGCYRPEDHIDNPKNYADNQDARQYDRRLRGPIDEETELSIDPESGMKNYIANERAGIMTSAHHVRNLFSRCIELGRSYRDGGRKQDLYESLRLMGTGLHCLEDFLAHSNYIELALIEMGERDIFPHVGRDALFRLEGANHQVFPIVTGTFGGVDFLHSVVGEVSDKMTQNEIEELENTLQDSKNSDTSMLRDLLDKIPDGLLGGRNQKNRIDEIQDNAAATQVEAMSVSPRDPEEFTVYVKQVYKQIMPAIEFHDDVMKSITSAVEKIPVLPKIIEQLEDQLSRFVFSIMAPVVVPLIRQIKNELATGSGEVIKSSEEEQHVVFNDSHSTDPTHSMLSKDHFSNILNEVAGRTAAKMISWAVPQIMDAIDNDDTDVGRLCDRIIHGILHHPAQRDMGRDGISAARNAMFNEVRAWWDELQNEHNSYRQRLSREGVMRGENHKEGVDDTGHGHGCAGKLKMRKLYGEPDTLENKIAGAAADAIFQGTTGLVSNLVEQQTGYKLPGSHPPPAQEEKGGLEGFLNKAGSFLGEALSKGDDRRRDDTESYSGSQTTYGRQDSGFSQSQSSSNYGGHGQSHVQHRRDDDEGEYGGGYSGRSGRHGRGDDNAEYGGRLELSHSGNTTFGRQESSYGANSHQGRRQDGEYRRHESSYGGSEGYGGGQERYNENNSYGREESNYGRQESNYGRQESNYGRQESNYGRQESSYGRHHGNHGGGGGGGYGGEEHDGYGRQESGFHGRGGNGNSSYGRQYEGGYEREEQEEGEYGRDSYGRRQQGGYGGDSGYSY